MRCTDSDRDSAAADHPRRVWLRHSSVGQDRRLVAVRRKEQTLAVVHDTG
jgi:hypothetical protein